MANARFLQLLPTNPTAAQGVEVVVVAVTVVVVELSVVVVVESTQVPQRTMHLSLKMVPMLPATEQYLYEGTTHSSGSSSPLHRWVKIPVLVVLVLVVKVVQLSQSTGQSTRIAMPSNGCKHCDSATELQNSGSEDPLQESVVVVVVMLDVAVVVELDVAVEVVVLSVVVVVVSTQVPHRTRHLPLNMLPMSPAVAQYL